MPGEQTEGKRRLALIPPPAEQGRGGRENNDRQYPREHTRSRCRTLHSPPLTPGFATTASEMPTGMHSSGKHRLRGATIKLDLRNRDHTGSSSHRSSLMTYSGLTKTPMTRLALLCMHALRNGEFLGARTPDGSNPCLSVSLSFRRIPGRVAGTDRRPSAREHCGGRSAPRPAILRTGEYYSCYDS